MHYVRVLFVKEGKPQKCEERVLAIDTSSTNTDAECNKLIMEISNKECAKNEKIISIETITKTK